MSISRRKLLLGGGAVAGAALLPSLATACPVQTGCGVEVPENSFASGTINRSPDFVHRFCLPDDIWQSIHLDPPADTHWVFRLLTFNADGSVRWHSSQTVTNRQCRKQGVYAGTVAASYITCRLYTGWVMTQPATTDKPVFQRVRWDMEWQQLERDFPNQL